MAFLLALALAQDPSLGALLEALGADDIEVREAASRELLRRGIASPEAAAWLEGALRRASEPEILDRLRELSWKMAVARNEPRLVPHAALHVPGGARSVAISPEGSRVATAGRDRRLRVWDFDTLRQISAAALEEDRADAELQFTRDHLVVATPRDIAFVDPVTLEARHVLPAAHRAIHLVPAVRPDGRAVAYGRSSPDAFELVVAGLDGGETIRSFGWHGWPDNVPRHLSFSPEGDKLICVAGDRIHVLETRTLGVLESFPGQSVFQAAFADEGLVTVSIQNEVRLKAPEGAGLLKGDPDPPAVLDRTFLRMLDRLLVAQGADRSLLVAVWLRDRKEFVPGPSGAEGLVFSPSVSANGTRLVFSTRERPEKVRLHRLAIGRP